MYAMFEDFVIKMLAYDPAQRVTPAEALKHPFVANQGPLQPPSGSSSGQVDADVEMSSPRVTPREGKVDQASQTVPRVLPGSAAGAP